MSGISTGLAGARMTAANNYIYGYAPVAQDPGARPGERMLSTGNVGTTYIPNQRGETPQPGLYSPAYQQQLAEQEARMRQAEAAYMQSQMVPGSGTSNRGIRTGLTPGQLGREIAQYENGGSGISKDRYEQLMSDFYMLDKTAQQAASQQGKEASSGNGPNKTNWDSVISNLNSGGRIPPPSAPPVSFPSYSANPAGGYTNVTQLGPVNAGPVTISQNRPADVGWGTGSAYDPNTGLSKWSTSGLTNGEMYYGNLYAGRFADEAARNAANAQAAAINRAQKLDRAQRIREYQDIQKKMGTYNEAVYYSDVSPESLAQLQQEFADWEAGTQQRSDESRLNDLLKQFSNPNYGTVQPPIPSYSDQGSQQTPVYTMEDQNAAIQAAINNPNLSTAERNQAISNAQQAYVASVAAQRQQSSSGNNVDQVNAQYNQVVQSQQQQAAQQQQQELYQQFQQAMDQANANNQARYEDIVAGYQQNQQQISDYLTNQGQQQQEDIGRQYERFGAQNEQDLISRGLGNTTVRTSTQRGIEEDRGRALRNSQEQIDRQRLQYETAAQQGLLNFMERRTDAGPNYGDLANLAQGLGSAGGGTGGGSGTGSATSPTTGTGAVPSYTNPANGQQTGSGYNPIFNTGQQSGQSQVTQQPVEAPYVPSTVGLQNEMSQQPGEDPVAWANRVNPPNAANTPGGQVGAGVINTSNVGVQGQTGAPTNVNPWTNPVEANKAGQIDPRQRSINMRSSGVAGIPSYNNQSTIKQGSYSSTQGPGTGTKTIIAGNAGWTNEQAQAARARMQIQYGN